MKPMWILLLTLMILPVFSASAQDRREDSAKPEDKTPPPARPDKANPSAPRNQESQAPAPAQIDLSHQTFHNNVGNPDPNRTSRWNASENNQSPVTPSHSFSANPNPESSRNLNRPVINNGPTKNFQRLSPSRFVSVQPIGSNVAHHHHPFSQGYVRKKLQNLGVSTLPNYITDRRNILDADSLHSTIHFPQKGPDHQTLNATVLGRKDLGNPMVTAQIAYITSGAFSGSLNQSASIETRTGHHYWHTEDSFNYCHYVDNWGYHWFGWYAGDSCFWTRYYADRWWFYDDNLDRWCFWDSGFWWWQDPDHVGDLYLYDYDADQYIPCDSSKDAVVTTIQSGSATLYPSPDGTRTVKILAGGDGFLFDNSIPPSFNPIYLASQVTNVQFSDTSDGSPLQEMLTLNDGSSDIFDDQGNPLNYSEDNAQVPQN